MKKIMIAFVALGLIFMAACGVSVPKGTVVDKSESEVEITEQECEKESYYTGSGTKRKKQYRTECEDVGTGEYETVYELTLEDKDGNQETHTVSVDEYESVDEGEVFDTEK